MIRKGCSWAEESAEAANNRLAVLELDLEGASFRDQQLQEKTEEVHGTRLGPTADDGCTRSTTPPPHTPLPSPHPATGTR